MAIHSIGATKTSGSSSCEKLSGLSTVASPRPATMPTRFRTTMATPKAATKTVKKNEPSCRWMGRQT